ncbi:MAG: hypothetical protein ACM3PU_14045 [Gemmatimonadota bacterium]
MRPIRRSAALGIAILLLAFTSGVQAQTPSAARTISITAPANDETVHSNTGDLDVTVRVSPRPTPNQTVVIALDDHEAARGARSRLHLSGVVRGTHTLQARLVDAQGSVLAQSEPVTFHMWQASKLFPGRKK